MNFKGTVIKESLEDDSILQKMKMLSTRTEPVTEQDQTPWLKKWTLHKVEVPEMEADRIARLLSQILDYSHKGAWYADFKNPIWHYIIFKNKIFKIGRQDSKGYTEAKQYGMDLGIPEHQVDFSPDIE